MVVLGVLAGRRADPEAAAHAEMEEQDPVGLQMEQQVFGAAFHAADRATDRVIA